MSEKFVYNVFEVEQINARPMIVTLIIVKNLVNVIYGYAPQIGRSTKERDNFWDPAYDLMGDLKKG